MSDQRHTASGIEADDADDRPMSRGAKVIAGVLVSAVVLIAVLVLLRVSSPVIGAGQAPPAGHYSSSCSLCHVIGTETMIEESQ